MPDVGGSYTDRHLGVVGRARELLTLWRDQRKDVPGHVRRIIGELATSESEMEQALGAPLEDRDILVVGPGQQLLEMSYFSGRNRVTGIDLDVIPQQLSVGAYLHMLRANGSIRTLKTVGRKLTGFDRAIRQELRRQVGIAVPPDLHVLAMDAGAMTFPDASFDCVFSHSCFEHLGDPGAVMRQVARVLRPGGLAHVEVHLYTSDSGCHDVRIFAGRRTAIPRWSHLRPQYRDRVQPNSYLNEIRLAQWKELFSNHWQEARFGSRPDPDPTIDQDLLALRRAGELADFGDEELLTVDLVVEWRRPM